MSKQRVSRQKTLRRAILACSLSFLLSPSLPGAQEVPVDQPANAQAPQGPRVTVHGVVLNASTRQPLSRALVKLSTGLAIGALTDGEGRFEISGVPTGLQTFDVVKPGFRGIAASANFGVPAFHFVRVAADMLDLTFALAQENAIYGQVTLSTGAPASDIGLTLIKKTIQEGRAVWTEVENRVTNPGGEFRFSGLEDGTYLLMTAPAFNNERADSPSCGGSAPVELSGFPIMFHGESSELAGAAQIVVAGGQSSRANLALHLSSFHFVRATMSKMPSGADWQFTSTILDLNGLLLKYPLRQDQAEHAFCAYLPDGSYILTVEGTPGGNPGERGLVMTRQQKTLMAVNGRLDFSVEGRANTHLHIPLSSGATTPVHVRYEPGPPSRKQADSDERQVGFELDTLQLVATPVTTIIALGEAPPSSVQIDNDVYELGMAVHGAYWIHASANRAGTCIGSVTAGGQSLAQTPWIAGPAGTGTDIEVVVRTDCAKLNLQLPAGFATNSGEEPTLYIYAIPDFDSVANVNDVQLQQSDDRTATLGDLTPGTYRVFVFDRPRNLEYQNPAALNGLTGSSQRVTLAPGGSANLVIEAPAR